MLELKNITKKYKKGEKIFTALDNINLRIEAGEFVAVFGPSGSGKSTLLHTAGGLIEPDSGKVFFNDISVYDMKGRESDEYRKNSVSFVFQQFHLIPYLTVYDNILLACDKDEYKDSVDPLLKSCRMFENRHKFPSELSVGEKQRTAFVRAIISKPSLLLADEPTGNLDPGNSEILYSLLKDYNSNGGTVLLVTHDPQAVTFPGRAVNLHEGKIVE